jgi:tripeptidyl-peptidase-2
LKPDLPATDGTIKYQVKSSAGEIQRRFVRVPESAGWATLRLKVTGTNGVADASGRFVIHLMQMLPHLRHTRSEQHWYLALGIRDPEISKTFKVKPGLNLEVCLSQFWSSFGAFDLEARVEFHGFALENNEIFIDGSRGLQKVEINNFLVKEDFSPSISLGTFMV